MLAFVPTRHCLIQTFVNSPASASLGLYILHSPAGASPHSKHCIFSAGCPLPAAMSTLVQPAASLHSSSKLTRKPMRTDRAQMHQVGPALPKGAVDRPYHIASTMPNYRLDPRSRSKTTPSTYSTLGMDSESKSSKDKSSRRRSQDVRSIAGSIQSRADRSDSMTKSLFSRGTKLLKRQNSSKSNLTSLRTLDWVEASYERDQIQELAGWRLLKHSRIDSTGNCMTLQLPLSFGTPLTVSD